MEAVVLDIVSILLSLLVPTFKPIETRLLNMKEKQQLYTIIDLMEYSFSSVLIGVVPITFVMHPVRN